MKYTEKNLWCEPVDKFKKYNTKDRNFKEDTTFIDLKLYMVS